MSIKQYHESDNIDTFVPNTIYEPAKELCIHRHYWGPNKSVLSIIENRCSEYTNVLEIGPGVNPFKCATHFIGMNEKLSDYVSVDIDKDVFPFETNYFDFIYCRHVMEDIQNPDFAISEMIRTSRGGYIETPSPMIEITKNVDAMEFSPLYCGYIHHRYIVWSNIQKNEIYFLPKYSFILDQLMKLSDTSAQLINHLINNYPVYWNNYFLFNSQTTVIMYKQGIHFSMPTGYIDLVLRSVQESIANTDYFVQHILNK